MVPLLGTPLAVGGGVDHREAQAAAANQQPGKKVVREEGRGLAHVFAIDTTNQPAKKATPARRV
jgi:hypothetical protein